MNIVTISSKYQIVIPKDVREKYNLKPGQKLAFIPFKDSLRVVVVPSIEEARGMLAGMNTNNIREEEDDDQRC